MTIQELIESKGINLKKTKLVRHNLSNPVVSDNLAKNYLEIYQSIQREKRFYNTDTVVSFLGTEGTNGLFQGCYKITGVKPLKEVKLPADFNNFGINDTLVFYQMEKLGVFPELINRLVIDWGTSTRSWCQRGETKKEIIEIRPAISEIRFRGYDNVILSYEALQKIVYNSELYEEWEDKLSAVAGVYLITDTKTGKQYVGSASGEEGGIWGRWSEYARTKHGGNKKLRLLVEQDGEYCKNFQYSILEVFPIKRERAEVLKSEQLYKKKLQTILFGLNDN